MISPSQAFSAMLQQVNPLPPELRPLGDALGYVLAADVRADRDLPAADRSAMDGYAVRAADMAAAPTTLRLVGEVAAGSPLRPRVRPGTCVRILTGANVPPGADTVVMVEQTSEADDLVSFRAAAKKGQNILRRAEDARKGEVLLPRGSVLSAPSVGVCAAVGCASIKVHRKPRITVLCTGAELREVGAKVAASDERNSNGPALCAALAAWGYPGCRYATLPDNLAVQTRRIKQAAERHDVVVAVGGVSVGRYDFVPRAVEAAGGNIIFHGVAMKPGKPIMMARFPGGAAMFGLPGNPLSAMVGFYEFVLPALARLAGVGVQVCLPEIYLPLADDLKHKGGTLRHVLASILWLSRGPIIVPIKSKSSADLVAGGRADGTIVLHPQPTTLPAGTLVEFRPWRPLP